MVMLQSFAQSLQRQERALQTRGLNITLQSRDETIVGDSRHFANIAAEHEFGEQRRGGHANSATVTFETSRAYFRLFELELNPDSIAAEWVELFAAQIG
jgi:hypothetical protein